MNRSYLLLGSNLGNRESYLAQALELLSKNVGKIAASSSVYNTAPWPPHTTVRSDGMDQGDFLNQAIRLETEFSANQLLEKIVSVEEKLGRKREKKWEARTIDIDILLYNSEIVKTPVLTIPHPFLHERRFALVPLAEIAERFIHPVLKKSIRKLLSDNMDNSAVITHRDE
ncbi:MAG: 2-amino-4-hydroxy-6-hydroxymethyldihydropteridine diphosphokinase [Bacteroidetes bacterium]|nr:MAG: 2-amino-4-hydroxy-6-hydroxymethyldihydropteridine diphosphokinase [Bacteroidota bacterium]